MIQPLEVALLTLLSGDVTLSGLLSGGVWQGSPPDDVTKSYLVLTNPEEGPGAQSFGVHGSDTMLQFDAFSPENVKDDAAVNAILDRVETLLRVPLVVSGHTSVIIRKDQRGVLVEDDKSRHGWMRFRFLAAEA